MRAPITIVGNLSVNSWLRHPWRRRATFAVVALILAFLALFPREYRAAVTMTPTDPSSLGLGGALGQLGAFSTVFGNQAAIEISLKVGRSQDVRQDVIRRLDLVKTHHFSSNLAADRWLTKQMTVRALRGGILQIDALRPTGDEALTLVSAFANATRDRLAIINRNQTAYKRRILEQLADRAGERYRRAQAAFDTFRRETRYSLPGPTIGGLGLRVPTLELQIKQLDVQIATTQRFSTPESLPLRQLLAQRGALQRQLAEAKSLDAKDPFSVNRVVTQEVTLEKLERELNIAYGLYINYNRYLEGTQLEDLTALANIRFLEDPYIDTARQYHILPLAFAILTVLIGLAVEFYQLRPPLRGPEAP